MCTLLLEGIAKTALAYNREEYAEFRNTLANLAESMANSQNENELLTTAEAVNEALENYNRAAQRVYGAQTVELRCMIEMLSQTLSSLAEAGGQSVRTLQAIRNQVESARQLDDIRILRARLGDSLKSISDEARRQRERNAEMLRHAAEAIAIASGHREDPAIDEVSGLPSALKAQGEIAARVGSDSPFYAAVFVVERVDSFNMRYGYAAGDQILLAFGHYLESNVAPTDQVYRWRGPTFVALLDRASSPGGVQAEVSRYASTRVEHAMEVDGRLTRISLSCAWTIVPLAKCQSPDDAFQQIDRFVTDHWQKNAPAS